ncbi:hypothetical protein [Ruminococcus albus]|uniref:Uncharacterized protein n=1 Tax=Ruminococcus albus TaxID=1264 RepID=A0A1I1LCY1_RUMAL|nr:hypothetical protein [Ruminococcus albus]SFC70881.1 hypothetical protein SAMN02910406_02232 [Ruminococcus albus]
MKKLRKMFENDRKNREADGAALVMLGMMWLMLDGMMPLAITFMAIGLGDIARGRKEKNR